MKPIVKLVGTNGNSVALIAKARESLRKSGMSSQEIKEFVDDAMSGDYDHVLRTIMKYCEIR
jgi:hypothetical protein